MTNKFRRSLTSVLLAASLLFSSQSVVAFADYGSKSDASDLSPVQESVENATEEQQEDPSLSVEPVIGESTEAPVAAPIMARANAPVAYSAPTPKPGYVELSEYDTWMDDCEVHIYSIPNAGYIKETYNFGGSTFPQTSGCRVYEATPADGWVFNTWEYSLIHDGKELGNRTDYGFGKRYTFSSSDSSWHEPYQNGDTSISVNRLTTCGEVLGNPLYYSVYANFSPLVTVTTVGNGSVTPNLTLHKDNQYKAEYGKDATFTITPNPGYEVDTVKVNGSPVEFTEVSGGNYTLPFVTEPTTLEVTFDKTEEQPFWTFNADENGSVKWNDKEPTNSIVFTKSEVEALNNGKDDFLFVVPNEGYGFAGCTGNQVLVETGLCLDNLNKNVEFYSTAHFNPLVNITFNPGDHGTLVDSSKSTGTITSDYNLAYLAFPEVTPDDGYKLVGWKREGSSEIETVSVKTPVEYVTEGITYIAQYEEVPAEQITDLKIHIGDNLSKKYSKEGLAGTYLYRLGYDLIPLHAEYGSQYILTTSNLQGTFSDADVSKLPKDLTIEYDTIEEVQSFFQGFTYMNLIIDKPYIDNSHIVNVRVEGTTLHITLDIPAPEAPANINELLDVTLNCENPDHPEEYGKSKTYSDLLPNSYTIGEVKNNNGTYTCDITINPEEYLADYNNVTKTNHILVTTPENLTGIATVTLKYEDGAWKTAESPVTFTVTCKQSIPLTPSKPSDDVVKAIMDKISVTVDCTNTTGHDPMNHTLTGAEFTVGDIYSVAPFADQDPVILCPVTINNYVSLQNGFITQYNAATNESHTLSSGFIPASIVLTYNKDAQDGKGAWENHDLENITLSLTCNPTTPGGGGEGTNPGGNGSDNDDDDDRYTGGNTVTRTINDDDVPLNDRPTNTTTIDDEDVPLADLPDDTVTIDDGEVPLKDNPSTGDSLPFAAMAAAALSLGGVIVLNRKKK